MPNSFWFESRTSSPELRNTVILGIDEEGFEANRSNNGGTVMSVCECGETVSV